MRDAVESWLFGSVLVRLGHANVDVSRWCAGWDGRASECDARQGGGTV